MEKWRTVEEDAAYILYRRNGTATRDDDKRNTKRLREVERFGWNVQVNWRRKKRGTRWICRRKEFDMQWNVSRWRLLCLFWYNVWNGKMKDNGLSGKNKNMQSVPLLTLHVFAEGSKNRWPVFIMWEQRVQLRAHKERVRPIAGDELSVCTINGAHLTFHLGVWLIAPPHHTLTLFSLWLSRRRHFLLVLIAKPSWRRPGR